MQGLHVAVAGIPKVSHTLQMQKFATKSKRMLSHGTHLDLV